MTLKLKIMNYEESLEKVRFYIQWNNENTNKDPHELSQVMSHISGHLFFLGECKSDAHDEWEAIRFEEITSGQSAAKGEIIANNQVHELYLLRLVINQGNRLVDCMRSELSLLKEEMKHNEA